MSERFHVEYTPGAGTYDVYDLEDPEAIRRGIRGKRIDQFDLCVMANQLEDYKAQRRIPITPLTLAKLALYRELLNIGSSRWTEAEFQMGVLLAQDPEVQKYFDDVLAKERGSQT